MALELTRRRFTIAEYHQMAEAGILGEDDRVELIDGEVVEMAPIGHRHSSCVARLAEWFVLKMSDVANIWPRNPIDVGEYSEPQPDLVVLHRRADFYATGHPTPADVTLVVEVADTSVAVDRRVKVPLYARGGIPEVWLVDVEQETVTTYRDPTTGGYQAAQVLRRGEWLAPAAFPDRTVGVADILG
ncbi:MAG: Uma2 family endonuclease [Chloroflexi bacterium]|nr:Uma2 family endonuclease [Chloroflexota bacterium]